MNGNVVVDKNRGIASIVYNYLDKPEQINLTRTVGAATVTNTIKYIYAGGAKVQKIVTDNTAVPVGGAAKISTTTYIGAFVYEQVTVGATVGATTLQSIAHEEGRIRLITPYVNAADPANVLTGGGFLTLPDGKEGVYDYFIKDHLGNIRATLTEEINKASTVLTMETANATIKQQEEAVFGNPAPNNEVSNTRVPRSDASGWTSNTTAQVSKLFSTSGTAKVGPNVILKVMAGDKISARSNYYYAANPGSSTGSTGLNGLLSSLMMALSGDKGGALAKDQSTQINNQLSGTSNLQSLYTSQPGSGNMTAPKSYLNYIFFDENFRFVSQSSGFQRVSQPGDVGAFLQMTEVKAPKNGYVYVYLSNESATPVYFDDFSVSHNRSALISEDHYYSFGLRIAAISSKAVATSINAKLPTYGYQGAFAEEVTDFELNYNEFQLRTYDPQIGRWTGADPYDEFASPYVGMGNDPINLNDPTGGFTGLLAGATQLGKSALFTVAGAIAGGIVDGISGGDGTKGAIIGAGLGLGASFVTSTMLKSALTWLGEFALGAAPGVVQQSWSLVARTPSIGDPGGMTPSAPNAPTTLSGTSPTIDLTPPPVHMPTMQVPPATNPAPAPSIPRVADVQPPSRPTTPQAPRQRAQATTRNSPQDVLNSPVGDAVVTSRFRVNRNVGSKTHIGTDYGVATGTAVHSTAEGTVVRSDRSSTYGNVVVINHGRASSGQRNVYTLYAHGSRRLVNVGDRVNAGQVILRSGNTGHSTGPHLHYEVIRSNVGPGNQRFYGNINIRFAPSDLRNLIR